MAAPNENAPQTPEPQPEDAAAAGATPASEEPDADDCTPEDDN